MSQISLPLTPLNTSFYNKNGLMNGDGEQLVSPTREEISTIFVVGFPEDMQEREFQNMFTFSSGFEAATLKVPSSKDGEEDISAINNIKKQIIGFAKFRTRKEATEAKDILNGRKVDIEKGNTLKAEMAKKNLHTKKVNNMNNNGDHQEQQQIEQEEMQNKIQQPVPNRYNTPYEAFYSVPLSSVPKDLMSPITTPSSMTNETYSDFYSDLALNTRSSPPPPENFISRSQSMDARSMDLFVRPSLSNNNRFHSRLSAVAANRFHNKELEFDYLSKSTPTNEKTFQSVNPHAIPSQHILSPPLRPLSTVSTGLMNHDPQHHHFSRFHQPPFIHTSNSTPPKSISPAPHSPPPPPGILSPNHSYRSLGGMLVGSTNPADQNPPCNTLYVGNLPPNAIEEELKSMFSKCAGYKRLSFRNKSNGPMCFVEFEDAIYAAQALQDLHGHLLSNSVKGGIRLSFSKNPLGVRQRSFSNGWVIGSPNVPGEVTHHCLNGDTYSHDSFFPDCLPMNDGLWGFAVASFCVGGLIGGLSGGVIQTKLGRKRTILLNNLGFIIGGILIACAINSPMFVIGRVFCGLSCGLGSLTIPTYIGEVATIPARGAMGTCNQFFIVIGILLSSVVGLPLATVPFWRINYVIVAVPAILQLFLMSTCVETPRYLISVQRMQEAKVALQKLRGQVSIDAEFYGMIEGHLGTVAAQSVIEELGINIVNESSSIEKENIEKESEVVSENPVEQSREPMNMIQVFVDPVIRRIALTVIFLHAFQQLVGINAVMYYSTTIFTLAFDQAFSKYMAILSTVVNFITTILAVVLIDRMGRRPLLLIANAGACLFCVLLVIGYIYNIPALLIVSVFLYVASFAIGIGPIPWMLTSELTPTYASSSVGSIGTCVNWSVNFLIGQCFPVIFSRIAGYSFVIFAVFAVLSFLFTLFFLPETKGRSLESIVKGYEKYRQ